MAGLTELGADEDGDMKEEGNNAKVEEGEDSDFYEQERNLRWRYK